MNTNIIDTICNDLAAIREKRPLVHSITNLVVMNETANAILCLGALPIMSHAVEEVEEMVCISSALVLNIGTLTSEWVDAMELAGKRANERNIPVILDPVGAGATKLRTDSSRRLLENVRIAVVRGNAAEIATLAGISAEVRGVESISSDMSDAMVVELAYSLGCTIAVTGVVDMVSDGRRVAKISNGDVMLSKVVGTGCTSSVMVASFAAVNPDHFMGAVGGLTAFGIAGEMAAESCPGRPGTFHVELYNALCALTEEDIQAKARVELEQIQVA